MVSHTRVQMLQCLLDLYNEIKLRGVKGDGSEIDQCEDILLYLTESIFNGLDEYVGVFNKVYKEYVDLLDKNGELDNLEAQPATNISPAQPTVPAAKQKQVAAYKAGRKEGANEMIDMMLGMYCAEAVNHAVAGSFDVHDAGQATDFHQMMGGLDIIHHGG